jgi:hypothetical protein
MNLHWNVQCSAGEVTVRLVVRPSEQEQQTKLANIVQSICDYGIFIPQVFHAYRKRMTLVTQPCVGNSMYCLRFVQLASMWKAEARSSLTNNHKLSPTSFQERSAMSVLQAASKWTSVSRPTLAALQAAVLPEA